MEDISMVLNTGEVPNLFQTEEKTEILERVQAHCQVATIACVRTNTVENESEFFFRPLVGMLPVKGHSPTFTRFSFQTSKEISTSSSACHRLARDSEIG